MSMTDPIANMLTMIRNATQRKSLSVDIPASKIGQAILEIMKNQGYIDNFRLIEDKKQGILKVYLKYLDKHTPAITDLKRVSKPGLRIYAKKGKIPTVRNGLGMAVISTAKGILTDQQAREQNIGGEIICFIW